MSAEDYSNAKILKDYISDIVKKEMNNPVNYPPRLIPGIIKSVTGNKSDVYIYASNSIMKDVPIRHGIVVSVNDEVWVERINYSNIDLEVVSKKSLNGELPYILGTEIGTSTITNTNIADFNFDKGQGGTLTLGGANNGNGVLSIKDAFGVEKVKGDNTGLTVNGANYFVTDRGMSSTIVPNSNLIYDHGFENIKLTTINNPIPDYEINTSQSISSLGVWRAWQDPVQSGGSPTQLYPKIFNTAFVQVGATALFGNALAVVNSANYFSQYVNVVPGQTYYISAHHIQLIGSSFRSTSSSNIRIKIQWGNPGGLDGTSLTFDFTSSTVWQRSGVSFTVPTGTAINSANICIMAKDTNWIYVDGVQLVLGSIPNKYEPESGLWMHAQDINAHTTFNSLNITNGATISSTSLGKGGTSGNPLNIYGGSTDAVYMGIYADAQAQTTRSGYIGYGSVGTTQLTISNEMVGGNVSIQTNGGRIDLEQAPWITPTLLNSWANYDTTNYNSVGYFKDSCGIVHLKGVVKSGAVGTTIFNLPAGYRPIKNNMFATIADNAFGRVDVLLGGNVMFLVGSNSFVSLDNISFRAEL